MSKGNNVFLLKYKILVWQGVWISMRLGIILLILIFSVIVLFLAKYYMNNDTMDLNNNVYGNMNNTSTKNVFESNNTVLNNTIVVVVDENIFQHSDRKVYVFLCITMPTPFNIYHYSYEINRSNNIVIVNLSKPFNDFRRYYSSTNISGDYIFPTLTLELCIYTDNGSTKIYRYIYDPVIYYKRYYDQREALEKAIEDPFKAFNGCKIYLSKNNRVLN